MSIKNIILILDEWQKFLVALWLKGQHQQCREVAQLMNKSIEFMNNCFDQIEINKLIMEDIRKRYNAKIKTEKDTQT